MEKAIEETKRKQWCAFCLREAQYYCCPNAWYCGHPCQQKDWAKHMRNCGQSTPTVKANPNKTADLVRLIKCYYKL